MSREVFKERLRKVRTIAGLSLVGAAGGAALGAALGGSGISEVRQEARNFRTCAEAIEANQYLIKLSCEHLYSEHSIIGDIHRTDMRYPNALRILGEAKDQEADRQDHAGDLALLLGSLGLVGGATHGIRRVTQPLAPSNPSQNGAQ